MKIKQIDTNLEKLMIISMIVSDKFIKNIVNIIDPNLLKLSYSKTICKWCISYYNKYKIAPHKNIQQIYEVWKSENITNEDDIKLIELFLEHINDKYIREDNYNEEYCLDQSIKYLKQRKLNVLKIKIEELTNNGQEEEAEKLIAEYKKIELPIQNSLNVFEDSSVVDEVINWEEEELFSFSGEFGKAIGNLTRGDLIAFAAPAKRGKSFFLVEAAIQCAIKGLRVAFFSMEMSQNQVLRRIYQNITGECKKEKIVEIPYFQINDSGRYDILYRTEIKKGLDGRVIKNKLKGIKSLLKGGKIKLFCSSPHALSVPDISSATDNLLVQEGFVPDVIIADYADITRSEYKADHRHKLNNVWELYRSLALSKHCLVITATHTNKQTFDRDMRQGDMSEDIRKINHVSLMIGINQKKEEKKKNIVRAVVLANRQEEFNLVDEIVILQSLGIGKPIIDAKLSSECEEYFNKTEKNK